MGNGREQGLDQAPSLLTAADMLRAGNIRAKASAVAAPKKAQSFYDAWKGLKAAKPDHVQWTRTDLLGIGYSAVDVDAWEKEKARTGKAILGPPLLQEDAWQANKRYAWKNEYEPETVQSVFPEIWKLFSRRMIDISDRQWSTLVFLQKKFELLYPGHPHELSWWCLYREFKRRGLPMWKPLQWTNALDRALEQLDKEAEAAKPPGRAGRKATDRTALAKLICATIGVNLRRAYQIAENGTGTLSYRIALAEAFGAIFDAERDTPAKWELRFGRTIGRPSDRRTFADYVMNYVDAYEDDLSPALATLRDLYHQGALPASFKDFRPFVDMMEGHGIDMTTARNLWDRSAVWCKGQ